ncbi:MAG: hypothetical protein JRH20_31760 [Deltaproteobacteria bacterium]|nr:hypothetical protein [Deltaproteobacteria bacterium]
MMIEDLRRRLVGERRALALLALGFLTTLFVLVALAQGGAWAACFGALALTYGVAFFGLASEWFWARWFAMGIASSGLTMAALGLVTQGWNGALLVWGAFHLVIYAPLAGREMSERYEMQEGWRKRYNLDDQAVLRIKRAVHSAATALPTLIFFTLAPKQDQMVHIALLGAGVLGFVGLLRMRFWGVLLLGATAVGTFVSAWMTPSWMGSASANGLSFPVALVGLFAAVMLSIAVAPFIRPAWRSLRG